MIASLQLPNQNNENVFGITTTKIWQVYQQNINNAYLHGHIEKDLYMQAPKSYAIRKKGQVSKLVKSLYGFKQAER